MRDIFTELYKKVISFFQAQEKEHTESKNVACNRLKLVLMQDRTNLTPLLLERMRGEMIEVLSKYVEMDKEALELNFEQEGDSMALMLSIPVLRAKEEAEIQAIIEAEEKGKAKERGNGEQETEESEVETTESEEEIEETDEDITEKVEEEVCSCSCEENVEDAISPDEIEDIEEESSEKKSKKKD